MKMELKVLKTEIKADTNNMTFEGYASTFGNKDAYGDIMEAGSFKKTIKENKKRIKILAMHDMYSAIGKPTTLQEDEKGLYFEAKISDTVLGRDIMTLVSDKVITETSIGYNAVKWEYDNEKYIRYLKEVKLWEISAVTWGANEKAKIKGLQGIEDYDNIKSEMKRLEILINEIKAGISTTLEKAFKSHQKSIDDNPESIQLLMNEISKYK